MFSLTNERIIEKKIVDNIEVVFKKNMYKLHTIKKSLDVI